MNKEEVIKLAREATRRDDWWDDDQALERFAALVAAHKTEVAIAEAYRCGYEAGVIEEREACALVCTNIANKPSNVILGVAVSCAAAIRNRGKE